MKTVYCFMIGLILFNFYACTKQQIQDPTNLSVSSKLEITYLDENDKPTENRTDDILMKLEEDDSGFIMVSRKTGEEEYTASLIDMVNNTSISMIYTNGASFPHKIMLVKDKETMTGYTSIHRQDSQDFDIIWYYSDGDGDICENIPLKTTIYNHIKTAGFDNNTDYQIKTINISVKIADAINKYVEENYEDNSMLRRISWKSFCNFWKTIFTPIVVAIAVVVAVVVPIIIPAATAIVLGVTGGVSGVVTGLGIIFEKIDNGIESSPGEKALLITRDGIEDYYKEGDIIHLEKVGDEAHIYFDILNEPIDYLNVKLYRENDNEPHRIASAYFNFNTGHGDSNLNSEYIIKEGKHNSDKDMRLIIKRRELTTDNLNLFLIIETGNNVMINRTTASSSLKLILK